MPTTYNGIGTHYYGRRNEEKRQGTCPHCGRNVPLTSYDTRLWFVIVFIPVIPLGRKRIIDQCPACTRHYLMDLQKWEATKQLEISGALDKFLSNPTPETAVQAHQMLVNFHQTAKAAEFRQMMRAKFADNAEVHSYLGGVLEHLGQFDESAVCFAKAIELRPDLPEARVGVAAAHIRAKRLDEARRLLDFLEKPGAGQLYPLGPLESLALAFQLEARHEEALQLFAKLLEGLPVLADHTAYRKNVEKSEKALKRKTSVLPARKFSWRRWLGSDPTAPRAAGFLANRRTWIWIGRVAAVVLLVAVVRNEYVRRHRTVHVVSALLQPARVEVRGAGRVEVRNGTAELELPEGRHHAIISGAVREELDFELRTGFFERWFNNPVWVLNVGGAAVLTLTSATYSRSPPPPSYSFHFGRTFEFFPDISHLFTPLPESMHMKSHESRILTQLEVHPGKAIEIFNYLQQQGQWFDAWRLAETQLQLQPDDKEMLQAYLVTTDSQRHTDRAETFLQRGLTNRPVQVEWHRTYQELKRDRVGREQLAADYDALLQADPGNSALLYLRGRVSATRDESLRFYQRAVAADSRNPYPLYAQGYDRMVRGDWAAARKLFQDAATLRPEDAAFAYNLALARFALGEYAALEQEYRNHLKREPLNLPVNRQLCDVLLAGGKREDALQLVAAFKRATGAKPGKAAREMISYLQRYLLYASGDFAGLEKHAKGDNSLGGRMATFHALLEQGRVAEALKANPAPPGDSGNEAGIYALIVALAWNLNGNPAEAGRWQERAITAMQAGNADDGRAGQLLRRDSVPTQDELDELHLSTAPQAILLAWLSMRHSARRADLASAARRLNVERSFPFHLLQRATQPGE